MGEPQQMYNIVGKYKKSRKNMRNKQSHEKVQEIESSRDFNPFSSSDDEEHLLLDSRRRVRVTSKDQRCNLSEIVLLTCTALLMITVSILILIYRGFNMHEG